MSRATLDRIFTHHPPFGSQQQRYIALREAGLALASLIESSCPPSRETSLAITSVQQAVQWANSAIAINEVPPAPADVPDVPPVTIGIINEASAEPVAATEGQ